MDVIPQDAVMVHRRARIDDDVLSAARYLAESPRPQR